MWWEAGLAVELDGRQAHATARAFDADRERDRRLAAQYGLHVVELWGELWVVVPFVILVAILGLGGAVLAPTERRLAELAASGMDSPEYDATFLREMTLSNVLAGLVLVAIFLMVTKLGA